MRHKTTVYLTCALQPVRVGCGSSEGGRQVALFAAKYLPFLQQAPAAVGIARLAALAAARVLAAIVRGHLHNLREVSDWRVSVS